jgi:hypothetical protein
MIWQICSGLKAAGAPHRGASRNRAAMPADGSAWSQQRSQCSAV